MASLISTDLSLFDERVNEIMSDTPYSEVKDTINTLKSELLKNKNIAALCAPQINKELRLFVVKTADKKFDVFLNPMVVTKSKEIHLSMEENPSIPDKKFIIPRYNEVHVAFQTHDGHVDSKTYKGAYGEVVQQMIQMLDGITLADYGLDLDDVGGYKAWDRASKADKQEVIQMYLDSLRKLSDSFDKEISENPELKAINDQIEFTTKYLLGEVKPVDSDGNIVEAKKDTE